MRFGETKSAGLGVVLALLLLGGCSNDVSQVTGPSFQGNNLGITALAGDGGLPTGGVATIRVEVFDALNQPVDGATVTLTATLGTLKDSSLTTANGGVGLTTLTAGTTVGTSYIVASVDNISATATVEIVNISNKVS